MLNVYLSGEIHSNWREEIINLCENEKLDISFSSPVSITRTSYKGMSFSNKIKVQE